MAAPSRLAAVFLGARVEGGGAALDALAGESSAAALEAALDAYVASARTANPTLSIPTETFVRYLGARAASLDKAQGSPVATAGAAALPAAAHAGDLLLACGCALGLSPAIEEFHRRHGSVIRRVLSRRRADSDLADDVTQIVYERLLVGAGGNPPKIAEYRGVGPLRSWVSTAAATTLMMIRRASGRRPDQPDRTGTIAALEMASPELLYMKERYKAEIARAIVQALDALDERHRMLLRLHLGERMSIDQLGALYKVNRATAGRWVAAARQALVESARAAVRAALGLSQSQYDSVAALVRSELEISLVRHLSPVQG